MVAILPHGGDYHMFPVFALTYMYCILTTRNDRLTRVFHSYFPSLIHLFRFTVSVLHLHYIWRFSRGFDSAGTRRYRRRCSPGARWCLYSNKNRQIRGTNRQWPRGRLGNMATCCVPMVWRGVYGACPRPWNNTTRLRLVRTPREARVRGRKRRGSLFCSPGSSIRRGTWPA